MKCSICHEPVTESHEVIVSLAGAAHGIEVLNVCDEHYRALIGPRLTGYSIDHNPEESHG